MDLSKQKCGPCAGGVRAMTRMEAEAMLGEQIKDWSLNTAAKQISKQLKFKDFKDALKFVNQVGVLAENEGHHPDIPLTYYNQVSISLSTHTIGGLSRNDFILAAKINNLNRR